MCTTCGCEKTESKATKSAARIAAARRAARGGQRMTHEEVRERNSVERIKHEKHPLDVLEDLPHLIDLPYEDVPEDDILRLQWWGLYHDKPKVGNFMMRVKIPGGRVDPAQVRTIGEISRTFGRNEGEITTRQDIQLHWIRLEAVPEIFETFRGSGLTTAGACGDILRNITSCPVAGIDAEEPFDASRTTDELAEFFYDNREYSDLPRKHKWTVSACPYWCNAPEIHDGALVGTVQDGEPGYAVWVGGGLSSRPRIGEPLGVFVRPEEALEVVRGLIDLYKMDLRYRRSRAKARFKFMVEDDGVESIRGELEGFLGRELTPLKERPAPVGITDHLGVRPEKEEGRHYVGVPVFPGLISGDQLVAVADIAEEYGRDVRFTREQNLIVTGVATADVERVKTELAEAGFSLEGNRVRGRSIACTGDPHCNFSIGETKPRLVRLVEHLEERFGDAVADLHVNLDGCPNSCGQHWTGDIGIQATNLSTKQGRIGAYNVMLRGGLGPGARIAKVIARRIPSEELEERVSRLVEAYLQERGDGEPLAEYCRRTDDERLTELLSAVPAAASA